MKINLYDTCDRKYNRVNLLRLTPVEIRLAFVFGFMITAGCDAQISRFDKATVSINTLTDSNVETMDKLENTENIAVDSVATTSKSDGTYSPKESIPSPDSKKIAQTQNESEAPKSTDNAYLELGSDVIANTTVRRIFEITSSLPYELRWSKDSGPGDLEFAMISSQSVQITPNKDGIYVIKAEVVASGVAIAFDQFALTWDTSGPTTESSPQILADSLQESVGITRDNDNHILLNWPEFRDSFSNPVYYTLNIFSNANCGGFPVEISLGTNSGQLYHEYAGLNGFTYSYYVTAIDHLGNLTYSGCSNSMTIDLTAPPGLEAASAERGPRVQTIRLRMKLPSDVSDYALLEVRRGVPTLSGLAVPPQDCLSGQKVYAISGFTAESLLVFDDDIGKAGHSVGYRVCIQDLAGNQSTELLIDKDGVTGSPLKSKEHIIFVTDEVYKGDFNAVLGGLTGAQLADARCQAAGLAATNPPPPAQNLYLGSELQWKALISDQDNDAKHRLIISGPVKDQADQSRVADDRADLWDGSIATSVFFNQHGLTEGMVWTGSNRFGIRSDHHCNNWTSKTAGSFAYQGDSYTANDYNWLSAEPPFASSLASCSDELSLYCISQPAPISWDITTIKTNPGLGLELSIKAPSTSYQNISIEIWRKTGNSPPDSSCSQMTTETQISTMAYSGSAFLWTDNSTSQGSSYSYRICLKDNLGNILSSHTTTGVYQ